MRTNQRPLGLMSTNDTGSPVDSTDDHPDPTDHTDAWDPPEARHARRDDTVSLSIQHGWECVMWDPKRPSKSWITSSCYVDAVSLRYDDHDAYLPSGHPDREDS